MATIQRIIGLFWGNRGKDKLDTTLSIMFSLLWTNFIEITGDLLNLPSVLGGAVVWIASFLVILAVEIFLFWLGNTNPSSKVAYLCIHCVNNWLH